jgi:hypothetical protein
VQIIAIGLVKNGAIAYSKAVAIGWLLINELKDPGGNFTYFFNYTNF